MHRPRLIVTFLMIVGSVLLSSHLDAAVVTVVIGEIQADGQFEVVWKTDGPIRAQAWSPFIPESAKKVADWTYPWVCGNCTEAKF